MNTKGLNLVPPTIQEFIDGEYEFFIEKED
jgi:hypothetical protein